MLKRFTSLLITCSLILVLTAPPNRGKSQDTSGSWNEVTDETKLLAQIPSSRNSEDDIPEIVANGAKVEKVAGGFKFAEGPLWDSRGFLLFSDIGANIIYKWTPKGIEVFRRPAGHSNGNTLDQEGRLVTAEHDRRLSRTEKNGKVVTLATHYAGKKLNSPNDVVVKSDGSIYFTDPPYGISNSKEEELGFYGIYRLTRNGKLTLLSKNMVRPNGIGFSPDEKKLYVTDSQEGNIYVFDVKSDGSLANKRLFADMKVTDKEPLADGMKVDSQGNIYATGAEGIWVFSPQGKLRGKILVPENTTNLAWGGKDYKTLYITGYNSLYRIRLKIAGIRPGKAAV